MKKAVGKPDWKTRFRIPIYNCLLWVIYSDDKNKSKKKLLPRTLLEADCDDDECHAFYLAHWPHYGIIAQHDTDKAGLDHEIGHVARKIMEDIGFKIRASNDEPLAYLEEWITRELHKRLDKDGIGA